VRQAPRSCLLIRALFLVGDNHGRIATSGAWSYLQQTNVWLKKMMAEHHLETRHDAYSALRAVRHAMRDRLTPEQAVHFGAQLPILVRGVYYEGWRIAG
jgi:uncharacterized protein (DUF2267 family)